MFRGIFSKIGRALSIFGVSNPEDIREMERRKTRSVPLEQKQSPPQKSQQPLAPETASKQSQTED